MARWAVAECQHDGAEPCRVAACRFSLLSEWRSRFGPRPAELPTCTLDVAAAGGVTLSTVGALLGVTRERARQIEAKAVRRLTLRIELRKECNP